MNFPVPDPTLFAIVMFLPGLAEWLMLEHPFATGAALAIGVCRCSIISRRATCF